ncbi:3'(2'),5'-bisphosphate nucleotidase CysQ [Qipengyuania nanhaisediminis]|uniref:3'(2'),5'-bisphosphate nucleotidase CysQ n=1 Tax=Qipengyuania nanhaisediminis TaxID=604088 RepID=UPI0038B3F99E
MADTPLAALSDAALAARLAEEAGRLAVALRESGEFSGKALGDEGDRQANQLLCSALAAARPDDAILSEEERDSTARLDRSRVWIVDPVDGTREYGECRADWAVHVALAIDGMAEVGAVALPGLAGGTVLRSDMPRPLAPLTERQEQCPRFLVSRTRPAREALALCDAIGGELVAMGSAGAKAMAVVRGEAEIYLHSGGQYEWDSCAPVAVARAHGLHCSRIDGSPLVYNRADPYLPDLLICRPQFAGRVLDLVAGLG